jgi:hypothetical protein
MNTDTEAVEISIHIFRIDFLVWLRVHGFKYGLYFPRRSSLSVILTQISVENKEKKDNRDNKKQKLRKLKRNVDERRQGRKAVMNKDSR